MNIKIKSISIKTKESQVDIDDIEIDLDPSSVLKSSSPVTFPELKFSPNLFEQMKYDPFEHMKFESTEKSNGDPSFKPFTHLSNILDPENYSKLINDLFNNKDSEKNDSKE
ncbi:hypothetical protein KLEB273_gp206 [Bacillus phage vB_BauM_KLEB27-3]|nr:hypothetical protein KLEB273_gp206 [Bacillus phage vB_BauM_KLEB27-3]